MIGILLVKEITKNSTGFPENNYQFKVNNKNTRKSCEICEIHVLHHFLVFLLLALSK